MRKKNQVAKIELTKTKELPKCTDEQAAEYFVEAKAFIKASGMYGDMRSGAECAVAEYIAYQQGYTIRDF